MRLRGLINGDTMSSESKDEQNGEYDKLKEPESKETDRKNVMKEDKVELNENGTSHVVEIEDKDSAHPEGGTVINCDTEEGRRTVENISDKLTNGTRSEPLESTGNNLEPSTSVNLSDISISEKDVKADVLVNSICEVNKDPVKHSNQENLKKSVEKSDTELKKESLSNEMKRSIVENVLSRYIQNAKKQKTESENIDGKLEETSDISNTSTLNGTEVCCDSQSNQCQVSESTNQSKEADTFSKSNKSVAAEEHADHLKDTAKTGSETQSNFVINQSGNTDTNRTNADDSNLVTSEIDIQNDLECPHLELEAPMEIDICVSAGESTRSLLAENSSVSNLTSELKSSQSKTNSQVVDQVKELMSKTQDEVETTVEVDNNLKNNTPSESISKGKENEIIHSSVKDNVRDENENATEKVIVYHEDTVRYVEKKEIAVLNCDKENSSGLNKTQKDYKEPENKDGAETVNTISASSKNKSILESRKSPDPAPSKPKGQKLDELLSKIATKASSNINIPKKAKARKSFSQSGNAVEKAAVANVPVTAPSITSLTFNVKMLEKQGVLDIPKTQNKRKAFEPFKLKVKQSEGEKSPVKVSPVRSPLKSPKDSPFFNTSKVIKGRRRKKKKMGSYMLPSEKKARERLAKSKERKKASEERQLSDGEKDDSHNDDLIKRGEIKTRVKGEDRNSNAMDCSESKVFKTESKPRLEQEHMQDKERPSSRNSAKSADSDSKQHNALEMLTKNSKLSFATTPNSGLKKAKKSVRPGVSHDNQTRTIDSFLKGDTVAKLTSAIQQRQGQSGEGSTGIQLAAQESHDQLNAGIRKRKADDAKAQSLAKTLPDEKIAEGQEEKKRKTDIPVGKSPPSVIQILAGSPPLPGGVRPIIASPNTSVSFPQIVSPSSNQQPKTIIQNGTINGLPVFQIIPNANFGQHQLVAIGTQGQSLLPKTAILQSPPRLPGAPPGMPVILTPVPMPTVVSSGSVTSPQNQVSLLTQSSPSSRVNLMNKNLPSNQATSLTSVAQQIATPIAAPIPLSVFNQSIVPSQNGQMPVLNKILKSPLEQNAQLLKPSHIPNGLYPVTPPRTPDDQAGSDTGSQESFGVDPGQQVSPDKDIIPLCTCKLNGASFPKLVSTITFCQALDSVDGKAMGCCNKVSNPQLVRPAVKIPFLVVCENHRKRLRCHQCCPGCGHFCTQGKFLQCRNEGNQIVHNFHEACQVIKDGKNYCPHCGETSEQVEVSLMLQEKKPPTVESKSSRIQTKAKMAIADKGSGSGDESADETMVVLEKTKKVLSTSDIPVGADKHSLERVLSSLTLERPKKYRHLPKCLYTPAYDNDLERVVYMLEDGHDANEKYDDLEGQGAIHAAAAVGSLPIVHVLVQAGASPHLQDKTLRTPLMYASENNHHQIVKYLLKAGAVIDSKADDGMTSLHYAAKAGHVGIIKVLLDVDGINIDVKDDGGYTPLIWAAEHEQLDVVKFLLKRNADPNLRDSEENTALHWAAFSGSSNVSEVLLNAGCELDSLNMHGDRPLHIASRQDHYECVVLFLARGADVELENNKGEIPMQCCVDQSSPTYLALRVNKQLKGFGARHMGRPEKLLHRDISKGRENIPIPCVNGIDDDGIPTDYLYVTDNIETKCLNINRVIGSLQCCQCKDDCSSIFCACGKSSVKCWYDKFGRLLPEFNMLEPSLIFECNRACECWTTCNNRVVQNGVMSRLQVFKTEGRGWGCKTLVNIPRGTFICEYIGEHISDSEADRREDDSYLFDLDNKDGETYCIDARKYGNVARFINHLCEPNLVPVKVFVDSQDLRFPRICLFASRDILAQEELGFDYGEKFWIIKWRHFTCTCGSPKCRYSKDTIQKTLEEYRLRHEEDVDVTKV